VHVEAFLVTLSGLFAQTSQSQAQGLAGSYLAATAADYRGDFAVGSKYLNRVLARDPNNRAVLDRALFFNIATNAFKTSNMREMRGLLAGEKTSYPPLVQDVLTGWMHVENGEMETALSHFDAPGITGGRATFNRYNKAMAFAVVGDFEMANTVLEGDANGPLRLNLDTIYFHADVLVQLDRKDEALALLGALLSNGARDSKASAMAARIRSGADQDFSFVTNANPTRCGQHLCMRGWRHFCILSM